MSEAEPEVVSVHEATADAPEYGVKAGDLFYKFSTGGDIMQVRHLPLEAIAGLDMEGTNPLSPEEIELQARLRAIERYHDRERGKAN